MLCGLIPHMQTHPLSLNASCVQRGGGEGWKGRGEQRCGESAATRTEPLFASGIAMETEALFIEFLGCSHSPAVYHSVHMLEANRVQFRAGEELGSCLTVEWRWGFFLTEFKSTDRARH